jgi:hypothetical protein
MNGVCQKRLPPAALASFAESVNAGQADGRAGQSGSGRNILSLNCFPPGLQSPKIPCPGRGAAHRAIRRRAPRMRRSVKRSGTVRRRSGAQTQRRAAHPGPGRGLLADQESIGPGSAPHHALRACCSAPGTRG